MKTTMRQRSPIPGLLLGLVLAGASLSTLQAQTVDSLIARHIEARGGMERLQAIETLRMTGRAVAGPGQEALVTREVRPPNRIRTEFAFQGVTAVYACADTKCWSVSPMSGSFEAQPMSESDASQAIEQANLLGPLVDWKAKGHTVELIGTETVDGREAHKLKVTLSSGVVQTHYLDAESALLVRREAIRTFGDRPIELQTTFSDFRPVGGVVFPHLIRSSAKGRPGSLEVVVEEAELNGPIDDARFEMPG
jgi:hypothetical protein